MKTHLAKKLISFLNYALFLVCQCYCFLTYAQSFHPEITNYSYGGSQNWSIDLTEEKIAVVANNSGLSTYNGQFWSLYRLPQNGIIRSVLYVDGLIYTGSYEEFGFWKKNALGKLEYHSLKSKFEAGSPLPSEEFWQILKFNSDIYFRSFGAIYVYNGSTIKRIVDNYNVSSICIYNNRLLFGSLNAGLLEINESKIVPFTKNSKLSEYTSISNVAAFEDKLFIYDTEKGAHISDKTNSFKLPLSINEILKEDALNKVAFIDRNNLAFGTVKNGLVLYDIRKGSYQIINKQAGLRNNTVLDIKVDDNYLWLALDKGLSRIDIKSEYEYFIDATGILGTVYDVSYHNNKYYVASNTGIYTFENDRLSLIKNSEGHCWGFLKYNGDLFCGHNKGAFIIENNFLKPIEGSFSGVYNFVPDPKTNNLLLATYSGVGILSKKNDSYSISKLNGLDVPVNKVIYENDSTIWASGNYKGLYKLRYNRSTSSVEQIALPTENDNIAEKKIEIELIGNVPYFIIDFNWFTYSNQHESFESFHGYENKTVLGFRKSDFWLLDHKSSSFINYNFAFEAIEKRANQTLTSKFVDGYEKVVFKNDSTLIFNLNDGFSILNLNKKTQLKNEKPKIDKVFVNKELYSLASTHSMELNYKQARSISFEIYVPNKYESELQYDLIGEVKQGEPIINGRFSLQNLPSGDYLLDIYEKGNPSEKVTLQIQVLPPWYISNVMKVIYLMLLLTIIYLVGKYQKRKAEKAHLKTQEKLKEEANKKIALIEKNNLINEIETKKKELTNRTASVVQKNETIILLRNELKRLEKTSPNVMRTKNVLHRSGEQLDSKNDWTLFETKFNELNEAFFKELSKAFPKLTTKDRKLCAYIKTGLSSKEIAPLLGITVRSVELQRYRLRKKLNLDTEITFTQFLDSF